MLLIFLIALAGRFLSQPRNYEFAPKSTYNESNFIKVARAESSDIGAKSSEISQNMPIPALPVLFKGVKNSEIISKLINCESQWQNVARMDSNGKMSFGILQYQKATWDKFSKQAGVEGSPMNPRKAVLVTDWAIENNLLHHWSCARILGLLTRK